MPIRFAASLHRTSCRMPSQKARAMHFRPANDNRGKQVSSPHLHAALRHFAEHGLAAADHARQQALAAADAYICDRLSQVRLLGELHHAIEAGKVDAHAAFPELGEVIAGEKPGRESDAQCILCDLTGTGVQDTAIATLAVARARAAGAGTVFQS